MKKAILCRRGLGMMRAMLLASQNANSLAFCDMPRADSHEIFTTVTLGGLFYQHRQRGV